MRSPRPTSVLLCVLLVAMPAAGSDGVAEAERLAQVAAAAADAGRIQEAIATLEAAYDAYPDPEFLYRIAVYHYKLAVDPVAGTCEDAQRAIRAFQRYSKAFRSAYQAEPPAQARIDEWVKEMRKRFDLSSRCGPIPVWPWLLGGGLALSAAGVTLGIVLKPGPAAPDCPECNDLIRF